MNTRFACVLSCLLLQIASPAAEKRHPVRLSHAEKPGDRSETVTTARVDNALTLSVQDRVFRENKSVEIWRLHATEVIDAVANNREAKAKTLTVIELTKTAEEKTAAVLPKGAVVRAAIRDGKEVFTIGDSPAPPDTAKMLERLISLSDDNRPTDDQLYGTKKPRRVGDTWPINAAKAAEAMRTPDLSVAPRGITGTAALKAVRQEGGRDFLDIEVTMKTRNMTVAFIPTFRVVKAESQTRFAGLFPADSKGGRIKDGMETTFVVVGKGRRSPQEPEVTAEARTTVKLTRTIKYLD